MKAKLNEKFNSSLKKGKEENHMFNYTVKKNSLLENAKKRNSDIIKKESIEIPVQEHKNTKNKNNKNKKQKWHSKERFI